MRRPSFLAATLGVIPVPLELAAAFALAAQSPLRCDSTGWQRDTSRAPGAFALGTASAHPIRRDSTTPHAATTPAAAAHPTPKYLETTIPGVVISGYAEASYVYSDNANGGTVSGRLYDRFQSQFTVNALKLALDHPYDATKWDAGFHADLLFGQNAAMLQSNGLSLGSEGDITQLYVTLNIPTANGNGVQIRMGKMVTLMGLEVLEDPANPNWSEGNLFNFVENFTEVGVSVEHRFNAVVDAQLRLINGWDVVQDNNRGNSFMGRVGIAPDSLGSLGLVAYYGPEQANSWAARYGAEILLNRRLAPTVNAWLQGDYGHEASIVPAADSAGPMSAAAWWGASTWLAIDLDPTLGVALRADYVDDAQGVRSNGFLFPQFAAQPGTKHTFSSGTVTLNIRRWANVLVRPEVRYDHSNLAVFSGRQNQVSLAFAMAYLY